MAALTETVELLVSEIVSNAINASARVPRQQRQIQRDVDLHHPVRQDPRQDAEAGRGLLLIEALSEQWGSYALDGQSGKIVWAVCA